MCRNSHGRCSALPIPTPISSWTRQAHGSLAVWLYPIWCFYLVLNYISLPLTPALSCLMFSPGHKNLVVQIILEGLAESRFLQLLLDLGVCFRTGTTLPTDILSFTLIILLGVFRFKRRRPRP